MIKYFTTSILLYKLTNVLQKKKSKKKRHVKLNTNFVLKYCLYIHTIKKCKSIIITMVHFTIFLLRIAFVNIDNKVFL